MHSRKIEGQKINQLNEWLLYLENKRFALK